MIKTIFFTIIITSIVAILLLSCGSANSQPVNKTFRWKAPTVNADGTFLTDLKGYRFYEDGIMIADIKTTSYKHIVPAGLHTYHVTAYDTSNNESKPSDTLSILKGSLIIGD